MKTRHHEKNNGTWVIWVASVFVAIVFVLVGMGAYGVSKCIQKIHNENATEPIAVVYSFPNAPTDENAVAVYRAEVSSRLEDFEISSENFSFSTDNEREFLTEKGYTFNETGFNIFHQSIPISGYSYPIIYNTEIGIEIWCMDNYGRLIVHNLQTGDNKFITKSPHYELQNNEKFINTSNEEALVYEESTGRVSKWYFGEFVGEVYVPLNSIYVGYSLSEGHIFRFGSDVYAITHHHFTTEKSSAEIIAHNVKIVVVADYCANKQYVSQPLFIMNDGTLKVYIRNINNGEVKYDDEINLCDINYEGEYKHWYN